MAAKKNVLFVCIGNSCRSQMAEGFGRRYGSDVMDVQSAGLAPAPIVQPLTKKVMEAKNINIDEQWPKDLVIIPALSLDLMINMSGVKLPARGKMEIQEWKIEDPIGKSEELYIEVRDQIEASVMRLILQLRKQAAQGYQEPEPNAARRFLGRLGRSRS